MKIKYVGRHRNGVEIAATGQVVGYGDVVDVEDDVATGLLRQKTQWEKAKTAAKANKDDDES